MKKMLKKACVLLAAIAVMVCMVVPTYAAGLNKKKITVCTGQTVQLKTTGAKGKIKWSSSNRNVATVTPKGKVSAKKKGNATITARIGKKKYSCKVTVENAKLSKSSFSVYKGKSYQLKMQNTKQEYKWSSKNKSVAIVTSKGKVTGKKAGTTYIYAKSASGKTFKCKVTVKNPKSSSDFSSGNSNSSANKPSDKGKVTYSAVSIPKGAVLTITNGCNYSVAVDISVAFCLNGKINSVANIYDTCAIEPGRKYITKVNNYNGGEWNSLKVNLSTKKINLECNAKNISYTANLGTRGVVISAKNNGKTNWGTYFVVVYYKNGKVIDCDEVFANIQNSGSSDYVESSFPYDKDFNTIIPDRYEVYVNASYKI